ncbi:MAG TPA: hypothetical protein VFF81_13140 [Noviherbaspirillum sp.]|nr:hypothetical protein [Noviherbaspirillum sp.]
MSKRHVRLREEEKCAARNIGWRTSKEINEERFALKLMRGDFDEAARTRDVDAILRAVRS